MATLDQIDFIMSILMASYPAFGENLPREKLALTVEVYQRTLRDIDGDLLEAAAMQHITSSKWFPTVAELREAALCLAHFGESSAEEAWIEVKQAIKRVGYYGIPQWSDSRIERAVSAIGWRELCLTEIDQEGVTRAHFMRIYDSLQRRQHMVDSMLPEIRAQIERTADALRMSGNGQHAALPAADLRGGRRGGAG